MSKKPHIRPEHVEAIRDVVFQWPLPTISWDALCARSKSVLGYVPSRSGLNKHAAIVAAFQSRQKTLKERPPENLPRPSSLAAASNAIAAKDAEIAALKQQVNGLLDRFWIWQYNASLHRVSLEMLDDRTKIPSIDRQRVKGRSTEDKK